jgi:S-adenosylmethionine-dependent methyltransferase
VDHAPLLAAGIDRLLEQCGGPGDGSGARDVLDLGGGTGGQAVRLAVAGHRVTVVDPSPDALAALARRADENGVADRLRGVQGDAENLAELVPAAGVDLVLCHGVLEVVDDPAQALAAARTALRPTGRLSLVVAQRHAAVLARVASGHLRAATHVLTDPDGRWGPGDPLLRRFDHATVAGLVRRSGFELLAAEGLRVFADLVPRSALAEEGGSEAVLQRLEQLATSTAAFRDVAAHLHVHAAPGGRHD